MTTATTVKCFRTKEPGNKGYGVWAMTTETRGVFYNGNGYERTAANWSVSDLESGRRVDAIAIMPAEAIDLLSHWPESQDHIREVFARHPITPASSQPAEDQRAAMREADIIGGFPVVDPNCKGCGKPLTIENAWITDGCPCNTALGVNSMNETRWRLLMQLQQQQARELEDLKRSEVASLKAELSRTQYRLALLGDVPSPTEDALFGLSAHHTWHHERERNIHERLTKAKQLLAHTVSHMGISQLGKEIHHFLATDG